RAEPDDGAVARAVRPDADRGDGVRDSGRGQRQRRDAVRGRRRGADHRRARRRRLDRGDRRARGGRRPPSGDGRMRRGAGARAVRVAGRRARAPGVLRRGDGGMTPALRVAVIADYAEEQWPSMDLVADMLVAHLRAEHDGRIAATLIRPAMPRRLSRVTARARSLDRVAARFADYPRTL